VGDDQRGALNGLDHPGHRHRLAGARGAQQRLEALALPDSLGQAGDRPRLIGGGGEHGI